MYSHGAEIEYSCAPGQQFLDPDGSTKHPTLTATCGWDGTWSIDSLMPCERKFTVINDIFFKLTIALSLCFADSHCLAPPQPDPSYHLSPVWNEEPVEIGQSVSYKCDRGRKFDTDFGKEEEVATCLSGNVWDRLATDVWGQCVESKTMRILNLY